ncbi:MAG: DUF4124 domain-containing protein [Proteobacteria bacterium]|nr:DUF4124 domain-containing protein [Pseudomonadota bacterium]
MLLAGGTLLALAIGDGAAQSARTRKSRTPVNDPNATVIYRCTDASGMLSIQSSPCPRGQHQERSVIARPVDPVPVPATATVAPAVPVADAPQPQPVALPPPPVDDTPLPPPPLYRCHTPSGGSYVNETDNPPERCRDVPLVNISGSQTVPDHECELERDRCERIPDQELCASWKQRLGEGKAMLELGNPDLVERATLQRDQAERVMNRSCLTRN